MARGFTGVHFSGPTNSTLFTDCCGTAVTDNEQRCPSCGAEVPYSPRARWDMAMRGLYGPDYKKRRGQCR
jgi:hypothetical protein